MSELQQVHHDVVSSPTHSERDFVSRSIGHEKLSVVCQEVSDGNRNDVQQQIVGT